jgi:hypothetical protein
MLRLCSSDCVNSDLKRKISLCQAGRGISFYLFCIAPEDPSEKQKSPAVWLFRIEKAGVLPALSHY